MTDGLVERLGLDSKELISVVGAGGKSTLVATLAAEYATTGHKVVLTTTTKMGVDQLTEPKCLTTDLNVIEARLVAGKPLFVAAGVNGTKVIGIEPEFVDQLFTDSTADVVVVEADGARRKRFKAPADHEPVIPSRSTTVIVVAGASAIGEPIADVAHRPEIVAGLAMVDVLRPLTPAIAARVLLHRDGGRKSVPAKARVHYLITANAETAPAARTVAAELRELSPEVSVAVWSLRASRRAEY